ATPRSIAVRVAGLSRCRGSSALARAPSAPSSRPDERISNHHGTGFSTISQPVAASARSTAASEPGEAGGRIRATTGRSNGRGANPGSSSCIPSTSPATPRAIGPTVSYEGESGCTPASGIRPQVVFSPATPQHAAGMRTEPPVSVPSATSASPRATTTAEPLDEPPGTSAASSGFTGVPSASLMPLSSQHSSVSAVVPTIRPPARRTAATHGASAAAGVSGVASEPTLVGRPATAIASLTATRGPSSGPPGASSRTTQPSVRRTAPVSLPAAAGRLAVGHLDQHALQLGQPQVDHVRRGVRVLRVGLGHLLGHLEPGAQRQPHVVDGRQPRLGALRVEPHLAGAVGRQRREQPVGRADLVPAQRALGQPAELAGRLVVVPVGVG